MLDAYLKVHRERLAEEARHLAFTRSQLARATDIGAAVRREREARGMSQEAVARRAGLSRAAIAMLERSGSVFNPPIDHVQAIAQALGTDLAALTLPKDEWLARRADQIYSQIAEELNWSVPLLRRFSQARWTEIRFRDEQPSADAMRAEMIWFQREWERNE
jgi:transcriptional regulator with XRE-family HTH domain